MNIAKLSLLLTVAFLGTAVAAEEGAPPSKTEQLYGIWSTRDPQHPQHLEFDADGTFKKATRGRHSIRYGTYHFDESDNTLTVEMNGKKYASTIVFLIPGKIQIVDPSGTTTLIKDADRTHTMEELTSPDS
jgi:hypothetical protein